MKNKQTKPLSPEQRELVQNNLGLVGVHLKRRVFRSAAKKGPDGEWAELYQEGCLGLIQAAADYNPDSGIKFPAFALRRIHHAVSAAVLRQSSFIRAPKPAPERPSRSGRLSPSATLRRVNPDHLDTLARDAADPSPDESQTIGHRLREKYLQALNDAAAALAQESRGNSAEYANLLHTVAHERLIISAPAWRPSLRRLARRLGRSYTIVAACERRLLNETGRLMAQDAEVAALIKHASASPRGLQEPIDAALSRDLRDLTSAAFMRLLSAADGYARSVILQRLLTLAGDTMTRAICRSLNSLPDSLRNELLFDARRCAAAAQSGAPPANFAAAPESKTPDARGAKRRAA